MNLGKSLITLFLLISACTYHDLPKPVSCETDGLNISIQSIKDISPCKPTDGAIHINATGGVPPYRFVLNDTLENSSGIFTALSEGTQNLRVRDARGCASHISADLQGATSDFMMTVSPVREDNSCFANNGSAQITLTGGEGPFEVKIDGVLTATLTPQNLSHGQHSFKASDAGGCEVEMKATISRGITGISWSKEIKPLIESACAKSGCHAPGSGRAEFATYADVKLRANQIKIRTQNKSMPFDGPLGDREIQLITCWVDDGALEN